jgi:hypothetical protein
MSKIGRMSGQALMAFPRHGVLGHLPLRVWKCFSPCENTGPSKIKQTILKSFQIHENALAAVRRHGIHAADTSAALPMIFIGLPGHIFHLVIRTPYVIKYLL